MCSRFSINKSKEDIKKIFSELIIDEGMDLNRHFFPNMDAPVLYENKLKNLKWGFITETLKEPLINIRAEGVASKPYFRKYFYKYRCLIPADSFYEWKESAFPGHGKVPYKIFMKDNGIFFMAGLLNPDNNTFAIITTTPSILIKQIHNRMPVILKKENYELWLNNKSSDTEYLLPLLTPYDSSKMEFIQTDL